jgi:hypothetical protein
MFNTSFKEIVPFMRYCGKFSGAVQATDDNMTPAHCILDAQDYTHLKCVIQGVPGGICQT